MAQIKGSGSQPFRFSAETIAELGEILEDHASTIIPHLEASAASYHKARLTPNLRTSLRDVAKIATALRVLLQTLDQTSLKAQADLRYWGVSTLLHIGGPTAWDMLCATRQSAVGALRRIESGPLKRKRGRPKDILRWMLATSLGLMLKSNGLRVTTSRDGVFGKSLVTVLFAVEGAAAPKEIFPLIKSASRFVNC